MHSFSDDEDDDDNEGEEHSDEDNLSDYDIYDTYHSMYDNGKYDHLHSILCCNLTKLIAI